MTGSLSVSPPSSLEGKCAIAQNALVVIPSTRARHHTVSSITVFGTSVGAETETNQEDEIECSNTQQRLDTIAEPSSN
jgi:adenylate cyclase class IV